jgi:hypothetical protein
MDTKNLISEQNYLLKWKHPNRVIILKVKFIKNMNNIYCEDYFNYNIRVDFYAPKLFGTIVDEDSTINTGLIVEIKYPFDHPLHPYILSKNNYSNVIGLFKIIKCVNNGYSKENYPLIFGRSTLINTPEINYNETLMWVDLNQVEIIPILIN